jgi:hypothetical protein
MDFTGGKILVLPSEKLRMNFENEQKEYIC